jgi:autonomous glycyl radical cofactor GrcA
MKKLLLGLVLGASVAMANDLPTDDLLSVATQGKTAGSQFEMSKSEMKKVDGGYYFNRSYIRVYGQSVYSPTKYKMPYIRVYGQPVYYYR